MRLLVAGLRAGRLTVGGDGFHHLVRVLRARPGDRVVLFDGAGREADAVVVAVEGGEATLDAAEPRQAAPATTPITLHLALLKGEKMDWVVQKATELGVARIVPVETAHTVVRLSGERAGTRAQRWRKIAAEAARQCGRADVPEIDEPTPIEQTLRRPAPVRLFLHETATTPLPPTIAGAPIWVAVGPEGGFSPAEVEAARAAGWSIVGLGPRVLRAETAALAILAILQFSSGDLGV